MANEVEITVTSNDKTNVSAIGANFKKGITSQFASAGDDSSKSFMKSFGGSFTRASSTFFGHLAENATGIFSKAFGTAISANPILGAGIAAALTGAVIYAIPTVAALASGLFVAGFGAGLAGLGIAFAAQNEDIKRRFTETVEHIKARMQEISRPFESTLIRINDIFRRTFDGFEPYLAAAFERLGGADGPVARFADNLGLALERLAPAIEPVTDAFIRLLDNIGGQLPAAADWLREKIEAIVNYFNENPEAIANFFKGVGQTVDDIGKLVGEITKLKDVLQQFGDETESGDIGFFAEMAILVGHVTTVTEAINKADEAISRFFSRFSSGIDFGALGESIRSGIGDAVDWVQGKISEFIGWLSSTWVGRQFLAIFGANTGPVHAARSESEGAGNSWASRIFRSLFGVNASEVFARLRESMGAGRQWLGSFFRSRFDVDVSGVWRGLNEALSAGRQWAGRVFTATMNVVRHVVPGMAHGGIVGAQGGGPRSNMVMVGEHGRELVRLPFGSTVVPNGQTESMMRGGGGGGGGRTVIELRSGGSRLDDLLVELLRKAISDQGGNVQEVLGQ